MGLDMYFNIRHENHISEYSEGGSHEESLKEVYKDMPEGVRKIIEKNEEIFPHKTVITEYPIGYFRKFNALHGWIIDNCADGVDECQKIVLSKSDIQALYDITINLLLDEKRLGKEEFQKKAEEELPARGGFFFGSTDYDEYYMYDLRKLADYTKDWLELLNNPEHKYDEIIYQASW